MSIHYIGDIGSNGEPHPFRVAVRDGVSPKVADLLQKTPGIELSEDPSVVQAALIRSATKFKSADAFTKWPELMMVARVGVGTDNIDMNVASEAGVSTINTPGASTEAVATRAVTFMLAWAARLKQGTEALGNRQWPKGDPNSEPRDLSEATVGVIGYGRIGRKTAALAEPFVGDIVYSDAMPVEGAIPLEQLVARSDIISVHASGSSEVLTPELLKLVKSGSLIVNTSRGGVINAQALLKCMNERGVSAALDVFPTEGATMFDDPIIQEITQHPLFIGTPHTAASDAVTQRKLGMEGAGYVQQFAHDGTVNINNLPGHTLSRMAPTERSTAGVRGIITHPSIRGTIGKIGEIASRQGLNIAQFANEQGPVYNGKRLAITAFDLDEGTVENSIRVMRQIESEITVLRRRLLLYGNGND